MNFIKHIIEPKRLLLAWQGPEGVDRNKRIVATLTLLEGKVELQYIEGEDLNKAREIGFVAHPAFPKPDRVYSDGVLDVFMKRLPPRNREDFIDYLTSLRISPDLRDTISDFALLGYSGAKLPSDGFSIIHPFDDVSVPCELIVEIAGFRYYSGMDMTVQEGSVVELIPEPNNQFDPLAIMVTLNNAKIGYIGRGQLPAFHRWLNDDKVTAIIEKINGSQNRPSIMLFITVSH